MVLAIRTSMSCHNETGYDVTGQNKPDHTPPLARMLNSARSCVRLEPPHKVLAMLDQWVVIDVREPSETLHGYLPFAINVPRGQLEFYMDRTPGIQPSSEILVYSNTGLRSLLAGRTLSHLGFLKIASLEGGLSRWKELGLPLE